MGNQGSQDNRDPKGHQVTLARQDFRESVASWGYLGFQDHQDYLVPLVKGARKVIVGPKESAWKVLLAPVDLQDLKARPVWAIQGDLASGDPRVALDHRDPVVHLERRDHPATARCAITEMLTCSTCSA